MRSNGIIMHIEYPITKIISDHNLKIIRSASPRLWWCDIWQSFQHISSPKTWIRLIWCNCTIAGAIKGYFSKKHCLVYKKFKTPTLCYLFDSILSHNNVFETWPNQTIAIPHFHLRPKIFQSFLPICTTPFKVDVSGYK